MGCFAGAPLSFVVEREHNMTYETLRIANVTLHNDKERRVEVKLGWISPSESSSVSNSVSHSKLTKHRFSVTSRTSLSAAAVKEYTASVRIFISSSAKRPELGLAFHIIAQNARVIACRRQDFVSAQRKMRESVACLGQDFVSAQRKMRESVPAMQDL